VAILIVNSLKNVYNTEKKELRISRLLLSEQREVTYAPVGG